MSKERSYDVQRYTYTGPTIILDNVEGLDLGYLIKGAEVKAERDINVGTITEIYNEDGSTTELNDAKISVASKYLEPVTIKPIDPNQKGSELSEKSKKEPKGKYSWNCETVCDVNFNKLAEEQEQDLENNENIEVGGNHYQTAIQPWDFIYANHIPFDEGCIIKYACKHTKKGGAEDVKKIISYAKHILKTQYNVQ